MKSPSKMLENHEIIAVNALCISVEAILFFVLYDVIPRR